MKIIDLYREFKDNKWSLAFHFMTVTEKNCEHFHEYPELVLVVDGQALHVINGHPVYIQKGDIFLVKQHDAHYYDVLKKLQILNISINPKISLEYFGNINEIITTLDANKLNSHHKISFRVTDSIVKVLKEYIAEGQIPQHVKESCFFHILSTALNDFKGSAGTCSEHAIYSVLRYLQTDFCSDKNWHAIAETFGLSHRTLYRKFSKITGLTPNDYLSRLRLIFARNMIANTREKISNVALMCGFSNPVHFSKKYKEKFRFSPREDRKKIHTSETNGLLSATPNSRGRTSL